MNRNIIIYTIVVLLIFTIILAESDKIKIKKIERVLYPRIDGYHPIIRTIEVEGNIYYIVEYIATKDNWLSVLLNYWSQILLGLGALLSVILQLKKIRGRHKQ